MLQVLPKSECATLQHMYFDLTDLRLLLSVHEAGTITDGAEFVHTTLAWAGGRIRGMEEVLGVSLLSCVIGAAYR